MIELDTEARTVSFEGGYAIEIADYNVDDDKYSYKLTGFTQGQTYTVNVTTTVKLIDSIVKIDSQYLPEDYKLPEYFNTESYNGKVLGIVDGKPKWVDKV